AGDGSRSAQKNDGSTLNDIEFSSDWSAINAGGAAGEEFFAGVGVTGNDPVQLVLGGAQVIADKLAEDGAVVGGAFEIVALEGEHGAAEARGPGDGVDGGIH